MLSFSQCLAWLAQGGTTPSKPTFDSSFILMILAVLAFMYLIVLRPQKRERDERQKRLDAVKKGDRIVTIGGIHGKVVEVSEKQSVLTIEVAPKVTIHLNRSAIATIDAKGSGVKSDAKSDGKTEGN